VICYELWCSNTKESIAVKAKSARVVHRIKNRCLVQVFDLWRDATAEEKQIRANARKAVQRLMNGALVSSFERWRDHIIEEKQMKNKALKVVQRMLNGALVSTFERWRDHIIEEKQIKSKSLDSVKELKGMRNAGDPTVFDAVSAVSVLEMWTSDWVSKVLIFTKRILQAKANNALVTWMSVVSEDKEKLADTWLQDRISIYDLSGHDFLRDRSLSRQDLQIDGGDLFRSPGNHDAVINKGSGRRGCDDKDEFKTTIQDIDHWKTLRRLRLYVSADKLKRGLESHSSASGFGRLSRQRRRGSNTGYGSSAPVVCEGQLTLAALRRQKEELERNIAQACALSEQLRRTPVRKSSLSRLRSRVI
jgi:hypothetical protein